MSLQRCFLVTKGNCRQAGKLRRGNNLRCSLWLVNKDLRALCLNQNAVPVPHREDRRHDKRKFGQMLDRARKDASSEKSCCFLDAAE